MSSSAKSSTLTPKIYPRDEHNISRNNLDPDAVKIMYRLSRNGFKAYLVGGGVRDVLLGKKPKDFDIATDATPRQVKSLFRNCRIIGRRFKLAHIFFQNQKIIEVSTFRDASTSPELEDESQPEGKALVFRDNKFGTASTDAIRRDLTINALFYDISTFSIIDYIGGMEDLKKGIIRVIGDPDVRFAEDPVRLLRVVRHAGRNGFAIEKNCLESLKRNKELIKQSSQVRVYEEVKKDLSSGTFLPILRLMAKTDLLSLLLPSLLIHEGALLQEGAHLPICLERLDSFVRKGEQVLSHIIFALLMLHVPREGEPLFVDVFDRYETKDEIKDHCKEVFSNLSVPRKERERIEYLLTDWISLCELSQENAEELPDMITGTRREDLISLYRLIQGEDKDDPILGVLRDASERRARRKDRSYRHRSRRKQR